MNQLKLKNNYLKYNIFKAKYTFISLTITKCAYDSKVWNTHHAFI